MNHTANQILDFLSTHHIRATYGAVGTVLGVPPRSVGQQLGPRSPRTSWVVSLATGKPTDFPPNLLHPALTPDTELMRTSEDLLRRMDSPA